MDGRNPYIKGIPAFALTSSLRPMESLMKLNLIGTGWMANQFVTSSQNTSTYSILFPKDWLLTKQDDPATLYTLAQLKEQGMDKEEIEECEIEIPKGSFYIEV